MWLCRGTTGFCHLPVPSSPGVPSGLAPVTSHISCHGSSRATATTGQGQLLLPAPDSFIPLGWFQRITEAQNHGISHRIRITESETKNQSQNHRIRQSENHRIRVIESENQRITKSETQNHRIRIRESETQNQRIRITESMNQRLRESQIHRTRDTESQSHRFTESESQSHSHRITRLEDT